MVQSRLFCGNDLFFKIPIRGPPLIPWTLPPGRCSQPVLFLEVQVCKQLLGTSGTSPSGCHQEPGKDLTIKKAMRFKHRYLFMYLFSYMYLFMCLIIYCLLYHYFYNIYIYYVIICYTYMYITYTYIHSW